MMREFKVNEYITLKLEEKITFIYVKGKKFRHCMRLVLQIPKDNIEAYDEINSIDEASELFKTLHENKIVEGGSHSISPEQEFLGHCSNIQAWFENNYDTRLLHSNLAFPLLKELKNAGDSNAKRVFKEEIVHRIEDGNINVIKFLLIEEYFNEFSKEEIVVLSHSLKSPLGKLGLAGVKNNAPYGFYEEIEKLTINIELALVGLQNNAPGDYYYYFQSLMENPKLAKWGAQHNAPVDFYIYFDKLMEDPELAMWGLQNDVPDDFYKFFPSIHEEISFRDSNDILMERVEELIEKFARDEQSKLEKIMADKIMSNLSDNWQTIKDLIWKMKIREMKDARFLQATLKDLVQKGQISVKGKKGREYWKLP